jgi:AraC-like DNA-binding protein
VLIGTGWAAFEGDAGDNRPHSHYALQLALGRGAPVVVALARGSTITAPGVLIGADCVHALAPGRARLLYLERESERGRALARRCPDGIAALDAATVSTLHANWPDSSEDRSLGNLWRALLPRSAAPSSPSRGAARVCAVIASLPARVARPVDPERLAVEAALSRDRFAHVFKAQTGLALRPYLRWLRLIRALGGTALGSDLTTAAHDAGFADAAHLSRTMRRHFGIALSQIVASLRDSGVIMLLYLKQAWQRRLAAGEPQTLETLMAAVREGAVQRVRPKAMTVAVILAGLLPILLGTGAGSEVMQRIAAPMVGGMITAPLLSMLVIPVAFVLMRRRGLGSNTGTGPGRSSRIDARTGDAA